jgi:hypothetical protein
LPDHHLYLPELRDDLFGLVPLPQCGPPVGLSGHTSTRITSL